MNRYRFFCRGLWRETCARGDPVKAGWTTPGILKAKRESQSQLILPAWLWMWSVLETCFWFEDVKRKHIARNKHLVATVTSYQAGNQADSSGLTCFLSHHHQHWIKGFDLPGTTVLKTLFWQSRLVFKPPQRNFSFSFHNQKQRDLNDLPFTDIPKGHRVTWVTPSTPARGTSCTVDGLRA